MATVGSSAAVRTIRGGILRRVMAPLAFGLVYDMPGSCPRGASDPPDADAEYEPEATVRALEDAVRRLGHRPQHIGSPRDLLTMLKEQLPRRSIARHSTMPKISCEPDCGHCSQRAERYCVLLLGGMISVSESLECRWNKHLRRLTSRLRVWNIMIFYFY